MKNLQSQEQPTSNTNRGQNDSNSVGLNWDIVVGDNMVTQLIKVDDDYLYTLAGIVDKDFEGNLVEVGLWIKTTRHGKIENDVTVVAPFNNTTH